MRKAPRFNTRVLSWIYGRLFGTLGPQGWWPARTKLEICIGVILTQNTAWRNVEKAIRALKRGGPLTLTRLLRLPEGELAEAIRPAGYFNIKQKRLRAFLEHVKSRQGGRLERLFRKEANPLREELLSIYGLGPESADSILLYAAGKPVFVVDEYTRRILSRHGLLNREAGYDEIQRFLMAHIPKQVQRFNEFHALLVEIGKRFCRRTPCCRECPLDPLPRTREGCRRFLRQREAAA